ncbi:hypothetical protein HOD08_05230 [bacterium]|nr:hypothetical protein [bacterium]
MRTINKLIVFIFCLFLSATGLTAAKSEPMFGGLFSDDALPPAIAEEASEIWTQRKGAIADDAEDLSTKEKAILDASETGEDYTKSAGELGDARTKLIGKHIKALRALQESSNKKVTELNAEIEELDKIRGPDRKAIPFETVMKNREEIKKIRPQLKAIEDIRDKAIDGQMMLADKQMEIHLIKKQSQALADEMVSVKLPPSSKLLAGGIEALKTQSTNNSTRTANRLLSEASRTKRIANEIEASGITNKNDPRLARLRGLLTKIEDGSKKVPTQQDSAIEKLRKRGVAGAEPTMEDVDKISKQLTAFEERNMETIKKGKAAVQSPDNKTKNIAENKIKGLLRRSVRAKRAVRMRK